VTPKVFFDFEFQFKSGEALHVTAEEGRDLIAADAERVRLELRLSEDCVEEIIVHRAELAYMRTTKRTVQPETPVDTRPWEMPNPRQPLGAPV
jgi:hypothetical protein